MQSAYCRHHSKETTLLRVKNDLLCFPDQWRCAIIVLLDLSAAFDTIDHVIMVSRLRGKSGVVDIPVKWFRSYLEDRHQCIQVKGEISRAASLPHGVPQGSVLGLSLFMTYTAHLRNIICKHGVISTHTTHNLMLPSTHLVRMRLHWPFSVCRIVWLTSSMDEC